MARYATWAGWAAIAVGVCVGLVAHDILVRCCGL
jgi:hypothetical protein